MPITKIQAGGSISTLDKRELDESLQAYMIDAVKGMQPVYFAAQGTADAANGVVRVGGGVTLTGGKLGPKSGYVWSVQRIAVRIGDQPSAAYSIYVNSSSNAQTLVRDVSGAANGYCEFGGGALFVRGGERLVISGLGEVSDKVFISGQAIEAPVGLIWRLMQR